jgi:hypothetical protein
MVKKLEKSRSDSVAVARVLRKYAEARRMKNSRNRISALQRRKWIEEQKRVRDYDQKKQEERNIQSTSKKEQDGEG